MSSELEAVEKSKELEVVSSGPVVAIQYPATVTFSEDEVSAIELDGKYSHLRQIDPDDKAKYKELVAAIADIRTRRTDVAKQEKTIKDPLNKFRDVVIKTSKAIRIILGSTEDTLKDEKNRIDDIREERKLAQQRLWQENLNSLRAMSSGLQQMSREDLDLLSESLHDFDFDTLDFGDYIEQAKATIELTISATNERIAFLVEQQRLADEKAAFEQKQAEEAAERKRLDDARIECEADAKRISDAENKKLRDQLAELKKDKEPAPEMTVVSQGEVTLVEESLVDEFEAPNAGRAAAIQQEPESTVIREPVQEPNSVSMSSQRTPAEIDKENDYSALSTWADDISEAIESAPKGIVDAKASLAVKETCAQLEQMHKFLIFKASKLIGE